MSQVPAKASSVISSRSPDTICFFGGFFRKYLTARWKRDCLLFAKRAEQCAAYFVQFTFASFDCRTRASPPCGAQCSEARFLLFSTNPAFLWAYSKLAKKRKITTARS